MESAGFVGLGWMGNPMAQNLAKAGRNLTVFDMKPDTMTRCRELGAKMANGVAELASRDIVFVMVNTPQQVRDVILGEQGLLRNLPTAHDLLIVVLATTSPMLMRELADQVVGSRVALADAPVSGGPVLAQAGQLSIMFGGSHSVLERLRPWFQAMAKEVFHAGDLGSGMAVKLLNNMVALTNSAVFLEALDVGSQWGLNPDKIRDIMQASSGRNWGTDNWEVFKQFSRFVVVDDPTMVNTAIKDIHVAGEWVAQAHIDVAILPYVAEIIQHAYKVSPTLKKALWPDVIA